MTVEIHKVIPLASISESGRKTHSMAAPTPEDLGKRPLIKWCLAVIMTASGQKCITEMEAVVGRSFNNSYFKVLRLKETE